MSISAGRSAAGQQSAHDKQEIEQRIHELGPWFHNMCLSGVWTAPGHFLADYPGTKWRRFAHAVPQDLSGMSVLDIGCNAGFYSIEMKKRGADRVVGIDSDPRFLAQARYAAQVNQVQIELRQLSVYDLASLGEKFDLVLFMGVLYHLRHPLLALDLIHENVARDLLLFQSMQRGSKQLEPLKEDYDFWEMDQFDRPGYPKLHFIEGRYSADETNWWVPNRACAEAMLRSAGFDILSHPEEEVYLCRRLDKAFGPDGPRAVYPARPGEGGGKEARHG